MGNIGITQTLYFDLETRSPLELRTVGRANYFSHPKTEVTLLSWAINNGPVEQWAVGDKIPPRLLFLLKNEIPCIKVAHNIIFDISAIKVFAKRYGIKLAPHWDDTMWMKDTMAIGQYYRVGGSLDRICTFLGMDTKQIHGKAIMNKQSKPDRKGEFPVALTNEEMKLFKEYGKHDVVMCRNIHQRFMPLPYHEQQIWEWTYTNNVRGIPVDMDLLFLMKYIIQDDVRKLLPEFNKIVDGKYKIGSPKLKEYFAKEYPYCTDMKAATVDAMLKDPRPVDPKVKRALQIKKILGSTSTKKVFKALDVACHGRIHDTLTYHKAITKRWSGKDASATTGVQIQNFPRSEMKKGDLDPRDENFFNSAYSMYTLGVLDSTWVKNYLRRIWIADEGEVIHCADYSKVEPVVIFWLAGLGRIPENWYEQMASRVFDMPAKNVMKDSFERHIGKFASLSCGYGIGPAGFVTKSRDAGITVSEALAFKCVRGYATAHPEIVQLWHTFFNAFTRCLHSGKAEELCEGLVKIQRIKSVSPGQHDMKIRLPSGGEIFYRKVQMEAVDKITYLTSDKGRVKLWHGALMEHICSGTARELMASALLRLEREGFRVICTVHDELWVQAAPGLDIQDRIKELMEIKPMWARGLEELKVEIDSGKRYLK